MSVLLYDPAKKKHVLLLKDRALEGTRWSVNLLVCDNPCCRCCRVDFNCTPMDAELNPQATSVNFVFDTENRSIYHPAGRKRPAPSDNFAQAVMKELEDGDWKYLYEFLLRAKHEQIENCDPRRVDAHFPPEVLHGDGTVVGYDEIFPLSPGLVFSIDSDQWCAIDDYCVNPECDCHQVVLQFIKREEKRTLTRATKNPPPAIFYDYRDKTFEPAQVPEEHIPSLQALLSGLKGQKREFDGELKKRHERLKALFKRALSKSEVETGLSLDLLDSEPELFDHTEPALSFTPKPGRNDPCPCGSMKKYKKCCGS